MGWGDAGGSLSLCACSARRGDNRRQNAALLLQAAGPRPRSSPRGASQGLPLRQDDCRPYRLAPFPPLPLVRCVRPCARVFGVGLIGNCCQWTAQVSLSAADEALLKEKNKCDKSMKLIGFAPRAAVPRPFRWGGGGNEGEMGGEVVGRLVRRTEPKEAFAHCTTEDSTQTIAHSGNPLTTANVCVVTRSTLRQLVASLAHSVVTIPCYHRPSLVYSLPLSPPHHRLPFHVECGACSPRY